MPEGAPSLDKKMRRMRRAAHLRSRELRMIAKGLLSTDHPILAHIIPMRRCNLSCTYCNEYDDRSKPVPLETVGHRLDLGRGDILARNKDVFVERHSNGSLWLFRGPALVGLKHGSTVSCPGLAGTKPARRGRGLYTKRLCAQPRASG